MMRNHLRKSAVGALAAGVFAGGAALALPTPTASWHPVQYGLSASPAQLLPAHVSSARPVRVVSTVLDDAGRPVVTVHTATDKTAAVSLVEKAQKAANALGVEVDATVTAIGMPAGSDPYAGKQWDLPKIRATDAWQRSTGAGVTVAVIDTGVDASHPDLAGKVLTGYDVINKTTGTATDANGHGTHVAGTIAAATGNGVGVSAVAPQAKILPIRVLDANGSGYMSDTATGIIYATDHGATVINMSLGSTSRVTAVSNAIAYARSKGVTVVAAAGNERQSGSPTSYPAADAGVIAVAATDSADRVASYSNQGSYVDVAAPGSAIYNTYPGNKYATMSGTSMASPHVAAVAALLEAYNPVLTPDQVEAALETSAKDLGPAGKDPDYGCGRIDAVAALSAVTVPTTAPTTSPATSTPTTTPVTVAPTTASPTPSATVTTSPSASPTASASPAPTKTTTKPKTRPAITVRSSGTSAAYGSTAAVSYTVIAGNTPLAQQHVRVGIAEGSGAFVYRDANTDTAGRVAVSRTATAGLRFQLVIGETARTLAATSPTTVITVHPRARLASRSTGTLTVTVTGPAGQTVVLQRHHHNRWLTTSTYTVRTTRTITGLAKGQLYRVVVRSTKTTAGVTSAAVRVS